MLDAGTLKATAADFDIPFTGSVSSATGGVSFQTAEATDPAQELEVIKTILLREGYLKRLQSLAKKQASEGGAVRPDLVDLLDLMRVASVEVVESIVKWRRGLVRHQARCPSLVPARFKCRFVMFEGGASAVPVERRELLVEAVRGLVVLGPHPAAHNVAWFSYGTESVHHSCHTGPGACCSADGGVQKSGDGRLVGYAVYQR